MAKENARPAAGFPVFHVEHSAVPRHRAAPMSATFPIPVKTRTLTRFGQFVITLLIFGAGLAGAVFFVAMARKAEEVDHSLPPPAVELAVAELQSVPLEIESQGVLEAVTVTRAAAEVGGRVAWVGPYWRNGAVFPAGTELLRLEDADYRAALASAEAALADARTQLKVEEARAEQAKRDWKKLADGATKPESDLVTREPQLAAARARLAASEAALEKARRDLARTVFTAPYAGRVREIQTNLGSWVAPGAPLAEIYSTEAFEIRLPLPLNDLQHLDLASRPEVALTPAAGNAGGAPWKAVVTRTGGEIDRASRSLHVIAELRPPAPAEPDPLLAPGLFVKASIAGRVMENVIPMPRSSLYGENRVLLVTSENAIRFRDVVIARARGNDVLISDGLRPGDRVIVSALSTAIEGMTVQPVESAPKTAW